MLDDRPYMRAPGFRQEMPVTFALLIANAGFFVVQAILEHYRIFNVTRYLGLSPDGLLRGHLWQLITFQFLHANLLHLFCNLIGLYCFGRAIEESLGRRRLLALYLASGVAGGLAQSCLGLVARTWFDVTVVGASAGVFGLAAAFATLFPDRVLTLLLFFFIPLPMKARTLIWISIAIAVFGIVVPHDSLADGAHLGGIAAGWAYVRFLVQDDRWRARLPRIQIRGRQPREVVGVVKNQGRTGRAFEADDLPSEEFISREVDPILDKISAQGIHSLTDRERRILDAAHRRMRKS